ncbi:hypothetical protein D0T12_11810 [Actinomadura spongiicola]|uniref:Uncharacterized protein n=1 Tax=Actinomadura spongiicola TaxID=2303421 RepID=A0A372GKM4_9ACTN|nr:hypothetical protein D0T12_11810 [Actinomadura spongiicola]
MASGSAAGSGPSVILAPKLPLNCCAKDIPDGAPGFEPSTARRATPRLTSPKCLHTGGRSARLDPSGRAESVRN